MKGKERIGLGVDTTHNIQTSLGRQDQKPFRHLQSRHPAASRDSISAEQAPAMAPKAKPTHPPYAVLIREAILALKVHRRPLALCMMALRASVASYAAKIAIGVV